MRRQRGRVGLMAAALVGLVVGGAQAQVTTERSASILVFPKVIADGTRDTVIQITNTSNSMVHAHCFYVNGALTFPELPPGAINPPLWIGDRLRHLADQAAADPLGGVGGPSGQRGGSAVHQQRGRPLGRRPAERRLLRLQRRRSRSGPRAAGGRLLHRRAEVHRGRSVGRAALGQPPEGRGDDDDLQRLRSGQPARSDRRTAACLDADAILHQRRGLQLGRQRRGEVQRDRHHRQREQRRRQRPLPGRRAQRGVPERRRVRRLPADLDRQPLRPGRAQPDGRRTARWRRRGRSCRARRTSRPRRRRR